MSKVIKITDEDQKNIKSLFDAIKNLNADQFIQSLEEIDYDIDKKSICFSDKKTRIQNSSGHTINEAISDAINRRDRENPPSKEKVLNFINSINEFMDKNQKYDNKNKFIKLVTDYLINTPEEEEKLISEIFQAIDDLNANSFCDGVNALGVRIQYNTITYPKNESLKNKDGQTIQNYFESNLKYIEKNDPSQYNDMYFGDTEFGDMDYDYFYSRDEESNIDRLHEFVAQVSEILEKPSFFKIPKKYGLEQTI